MMTNRIRITEILIFIILLGLSSCDNKKNPKSKEGGLPEETQKSITFSQSEELDLLSKTTWLPIFKTDSGEVYITNCAGGSLSFKVEKKGEEAFFEFINVQYSWSFSIEEIQIAENGFRILRLVDIKNNNPIDISYKFKPDDRIELLDLDPLNQVNGLTLDSAYFPKLDRVDLINLENLSNFQKAYAYCEEMQEMW